jgi:serine/threonine protein kinase
MKHLLKNPFNVKRSSDSKTSSHSVQISEDILSLNTEHKGPLKKQCSGYIAPKPTAVSLLPPISSSPSSASSSSSSQPDSPSPSPSLMYEGSYTSRTSISYPEHYTPLGCLPSIENIVLAQRADGKIVVIKVTKYSALTRQPLNLHEIYIQMQLSDEINSKCYGYRNIVHYYDHFVTSSLTTTEMGLVMEYCELHSLFEATIDSPRPFPSEILRSLTKDIVAAVYFIHSMGFAHRDIKLENMMLTFDREKNRVVVKLGDFEYSQAHKKDNIITETHIPGSYDYASPELVQKVEKDLFAVDMWALGVSLFLLLEKARMFDGRGSLHLLHALITSNSRQAYKQVSPEYMYLRELINSMTQYDFEERIKIKDARRSTWFKGATKKVLPSDLKLSSQKKET